MPGYLEFSASLGAVGVIVRLEAAYRLLGVPQHQIANRTLDADEVLGRAVHLWQDTLMNVSKAEDRVYGIQAVLRDWLKGRDRRDQVLEHAVRRLRRLEGRVRIEELARDVGWSRRQLERTFQNHVGVGPKSMASIFRFHAVYKRLRHGAGTPLGDLILGHYYDQSHFLKDFRRYTESTLRTYRNASDYGNFYIPS